MIVDLCAHAGNWAHRPIGLEPAALADLLRPFGISTIFAGRLEAAWFEDPHDANRLEVPHTRTPAVVPVPVLDPTVATWRDELERLSRATRPMMVRLLPNYGGYPLASADPLLAVLAERGIIAQVLVRLEDPRRQHRLAQVADVPAREVFDAATRHPELSVLLSGGSATDLARLAPRLAEAPRLWADTSQADGVGAIADLMTTAWRDRLAFGTHAPLFIPYSAVARVVLDLDDATAERVLRRNASALLGERGEG